MTKRKYPRDEKNRAVLDNKYGITITKPWNRDMYNHNDKVRELQESHVKAAIDKAVNEDDYDTLHTLAKALWAHGFGMGYETVEALKAECDRYFNNNYEDNWWWNSDVYPSLLKAGLVPELEIDYIGY